MEHRAGLGVRQLLQACMIACAVVALGILLTWHGANRVLHSDAAEEARRWAQFIERNLSDLDGVFAGEPISKQDEQVLRIATVAGNVFRYVFFAPDGRVMFASDFLRRGEDYSDLVGVEVEELAPGLARGEVVTLLEDGREKPNRPDYYAEAYLPVSSSSGNVGVIEVYVDQSERVVRYWDVVRFLMTGFAFMLILAAILPGAFIRRQYERIRRAEAHIFELAYRDTLTGLANRRQFQADLEEIVGSGVRGALVLIDLDQFKSVNDSRGHSAGDELLVRVAKILRSESKNSACLARIGGDEFAIVLDDYSDIQDIIERVQQLQSAVHTHLSDSDFGRHSGLSAGVALFPEQGSDPQRLLKCADTALYRAKAQERGTYRLFDESMQRDLQARLEREAELVQALEQDQFDIHLQPTFSPNNDLPVAAEALLRWRHPEKGLLTAGAFLADLEDGPLLKRLSDVALVRSCEALARLHACGHVHFKVAVNLSGGQLRDETLVDRLTDLLLRHDLKPNCLLLEVTETVVLGQESALIYRHLQELHEAGFGLSLDDFGTGYASLSHLKRLPVQQIKIDRSFVQGMGRDMHDTAIVEATISLAKSLKLEVVAEGVESAEHESRLADLGCDRLQGFGLAKPMSIDDLLAQLDQRTNSRVAGKSEHKSQFATI